ncbi:MAG: hypothetical protein HQL28_00840 [Candidatus Omnitrophica bacterium]|nr:hypothetical protein [Candidatus Omnitrophota bacterium]
MIEIFQDITLKRKAEENMSRLFKSFEQIKDSGSAKSGTGLGLAISKKIIEQHKGKIWAESKWGTGSEFQFMVPLKHAT